MREKINTLNKYLERFLPLLVLIIAETLCQRFCIKELNPPETSRIYSSVLNDTSTLIYYNESALDSPLSWCAATNDINQFITIDLEEEYQIAGIILQPSSISPLRTISSYLLEYSTDGTIYVNYQGSFFKGSDYITTNLASKESSFLLSFIRARFVRIKIKTWSNSICARVGIAYYYYFPDTVVDSDLPLSNPIYEAADDCMPVVYSKKHFYNPQTKVINACDVSCDGCSLSSTYCINCQPKYGRDSIDSRKCINCISPCDLCWPTASVCTTCINRHILLSGSCHPCNSNCNLCEISVDNCKNCNLGFYLDTASSPKRCLLCQAPCLHCSSITQCVNCRDGYYYVKDYQCLPCNQPCKTCIDNADKCLSCSQSGLFLVINGPLANKCILEANSRGYFLKNNFYSVCDQSCETCITAQTFCLICKTGYFPHEDNPNRCSKSPVDYYYFDSVANLFRKCHQSCRICTGPGEKCIVCNIASRFYKLASPNVSEIDICFQLETMPQYFVDPNVNTLKPCDISCNRCSVSSLNCNACATEYYRIENPRVSTESNYCFKLYSKQDYFLDVNILRQCDSSCVTCTLNKLNCSQCKDGFYRLADAVGTIAEKYCYSNKQNYYLDSPNTILKKCDDSCNECSTEPKNCSACTAGFYNLADASGLSLKYL